MPPFPSERVRILQIIARLNIGGPAIHTIMLTQLMARRGYPTTLLRGVEGPDEGNMDYLANELGVEPLLVSSMGPLPSWRDFPAVAELIRRIRRERPTIVHTHTAKAGALGRVAAVLAFPLRHSRPMLVHTFHGHSLSGYFSPRKAMLYRGIERILARSTDRLIAVSDEVRDDLVSMGIAPLSKFKVVPLGFDLSRFAADDIAQTSARQTLRSELGIPPLAPVVTLIARLVPIKRVDRFLQVAALLRDVPDARFLIVGDGELRDDLQRSAAAQSLGERLIWTGFRRDMPAVYFASDVVVQTSDNEGTPVSLIEAQAAGVPVVSTRVGGTPSVVLNGVTGALVERHDLDGLAAHVRRLLDDPNARKLLGDAGRERALERFRLDRFVEQMDEFYEELHAGLDGVRARLTGLAS